MLANQTSQAIATLRPGLYTGRMDHPFLAQDYWRVASNLTVNLGMRYDFYSDLSAQAEDATPDAGL